jgi:hypothetical protein
MDTTQAKKCSGVKQPGVFRELRQLDIRPMHERRNAGWLVWNALINFY